MTMRCAPVGKVDSAKMADPPMLGLNSSVVRPMPTLANGHQWRYRVIVPPMSAQ
jgi:hypothetical protein